MKCDEVRELFPDLWAGVLEEDTRSKIQSHLTRCPACQDENESLSMVWMKLGELPEEKPSDAVRPRFYAMLEGYKQGLDQAKPSRRWREMNKRLNKGTQPALNPEQIHHAMSFRRLLN